MLRSFNFMNDSIHENEDVSWSTRHSKRTTEAMFHNQKFVASTDADVQNEPEGAIEPEAKGELQRQKLVKATYGTGPRSAFSMDLPQEGISREFTNKIMYPETLAQFAPEIPQ